MRWLLFALPLFFSSCDTDAAVTADGGTSAEVEPLHDLCAHQFPVSTACGGTIYTEVPLWTETTDHWCADPRFRGEAWAVSLPNGTGPRSEFCLTCVTMGLDPEPPGSPPYQGPGYSVGAFGCPVDDCLAYQCKAQIEERSR